ncbi:MAG: hypothetical protein V8Q76_12270 [Bacteroides intestinalis]
MNKIAPKLLVGNTSLSGKSWSEAKEACERKATDGVCLPSAKCI